MSKIHVIYENEAWLEPLAKVLDEHEVPWAGWDFSEGDFDLTSRPPEGIFFNRMSASAHTRGHAHSPEYTIAALAWLERAGRRVINGASVVDLEISKVRQYTALEQAGIAVPRTTAILGRNRLVEAARRDFGGDPVILKPNRGGKGLGVQLFASADALADYLDGPDYEAPVDGIHLLQEYVSAPQPFITRTEFVGGKFLYAVRVDTSDGFELCPADVCAVGDAMCPVGEAPTTMNFIGEQPTTMNSVGEQPTPPKFEIVPDIDAGRKAAYERFLAENRIEFAGIEFIVAPDGRVLTYDVNTNTNYNPEAEKRAGKSGMTAIATYLKRELDRLYSPAAAAE